MHVRTMQPLLAASVPRASRARQVQQDLVRLAVMHRNPRKLPQKLQFVKHDPVVNKHVLFTEQKLR